MFLQDQERMRLGNMPESLAVKVLEMLKEFDGCLKILCKKHNLNADIIRSLDVCFFAVCIDKQNIFMFGKIYYIPYVTDFYFHLPERELSEETALDFVQSQLGDLNDENQIFRVKFPKEILDQDSNNRRDLLKHMAATHVQAELKRSRKVKIQPVFGDASFEIYEQLAFVLMPFNTELNYIYNDIIKTAVVDEGLVCRRADDIKSNKVIMFDIWKSICEARIVIADLTGLNPNVMYELGISHTVGKETIIIYQQNEEEIKFPFDIAHIRIIQYKNDAVGGSNLRKDLSATLKSIIKQKILQMHGLISQLISVSHGELFTLPLFPSCEAVKVFDFTLKAPQYEPSLSNCLQYNILHASVSLFVILSQPRRSVTRGEYPSVRNERRYG